MLSAGFIILATSTFKLNMEMGIITVISILSALILDFLLLPVLLLAFDKDKKLAHEDRIKSKQLTNS